MMSGLKTYRWVLVMAAALFAAVGVILTPHLSRERRLLEEANVHLEERKYPEALNEFESAVRYAPKSKEGLEAAEKGGETALFHSTEFQRAVFFFRSIVLNSSDLADITEAQKKIADIYYEKLGDYAQAILEFQRVLQSKLGPMEEQAIEMKIAKSYFYMANFEQAIFEATHFMQKHPKSSFIFEANMLIGNSYLALKQHDKAIQTFDKIEKYYADYKESYQATINKALAYEEKDDFNRALATLESARGKYPQLDILEVKIRGLQRRIAQTKTKGSTVPH